jgi:hypothetical protein
MKINIVISDTQYDCKILRENLRNISYKPDSEKINELIKNPRSFKEIRFNSDYKLIKEYDDLLIRYRPGTYAEFCSFFDFGSLLYGLRFMLSAPWCDLSHVPIDDNFGKQIRNSVGFSFINDNCIHKAFKEITEMIIYCIINKLNLSNYTVYFKDEYDRYMHEFNKSTYEHCDSLKGKYGI